MQGCLEAQQWLAALAQWCEGADGARVKQQLSELLRCGSRHRDKLVGVANRARQQIASIFRCVGCMPPVGYGKALLSTWSFPMDAYAHLACCSAVRCACCAGSSGVLTFWVLTSWVLTC